MELSEEKAITQLLSYIENTLYLRSSSKGKRKDTENIILLILLTGTAGSVSPILLSYTQQITLSEFQISSKGSFLSN